MSDEQLRILDESIQTAALTIATAILIAADLDGATLAEVFNREIAMARAILRDALSTVKAAGNR
jgi:hypothetical protein